MPYEEAKQFASADSASKAWGMGSLWLTQVPIRTHCRTCWLQAIVPDEEFGQSKISGRAANGGNGLYLTNSQNMYIFGFHDLHKWGLTKGRKGHVKAILHV
jgi:hypothetical protein